jgi:alpha-ketoglutarate-dependent taurine dioxygenase
MAVITTEKQTSSVGALVEGVEIEHLLHDPTFPAMVPRRTRGERGAGVSGSPSRRHDPGGVEPASRPVELFGDGEHAEIFRVTLDPRKNPAATYLRGTFDWHIDGCTDDIPIMATMLSAHAVAEEGGETEFASSYLAYENLPDEEQARLESVRVVHTIEASQRLVEPDPSPELVELWRQRPAKEHPLVWTHRSGRKSLVLGATTDHVVGMDPDESRALLDDLLARATTPDRVYRHEWQVGDVVIWDNRGVLHRALPYDASSPRDMHRTTFAGDEPIQ